MANSKCIEANRDNIVAMQRSFSDIDYVALLAERKISIAIEEIKLVLAQPDTGAMRSTIQTLCETIHFHAFDAMNVANCEAERWGANYVNEVERAERHAKCSAAAALSRAVPPTGV